MTDQPSSPLPAPNPDPKALATELAGLLGREQGGALLEQARALSVLNANRPGSQTSEFKLSILGVLAGLSILVLGSWKGNQELASQGLDLVQWSIAGYAVARGLTKAGAAKVPAK